MTDEDTQLRNVIIRLATERGEIAPLDDGYQYFWPSQKGAISAGQLRILADHLDELNKDWDEIVRRDLEG